MSDEKEQKEDAYNGYSNYPTWLIHLWLTSIEQSYTVLLSLATQSKSVEELAGKAKAMVMGYKPLRDYVHTPLAQMYEDLIDTALEEVNWIEVVQFIWGNPITEGDNDCGDKE